MTQILKKEQEVTSPIIPPLTESARDKAKRELVAKLSYQRDKDREVVKGIFRFYEVPGASLSFVYKAYKGEETIRYDLVDGEVYSLPLGVARHLNKSGWYPIHAHTKGEDDKPSMKIGHKVRRYGFQSLEFVDIDDLSEHGSPLLTVQYAEPVL